MKRPATSSAAGTSAALSLLFLVVYGGCNWITAHRTDVGTWYYEWEKHIPFVPLMIVPYLSIDLFFVAAPFLCQSRAELRTLARRVSFAILVAGVCFLLVPLRLAVERPHVYGWTGLVFSCLCGFDQPSNLVPSLHITLLTILANLYARHTKGAWRTAVHVWFSLIGFSTVLTYQHHVADVAGGFVLATLCFYLFRENTQPLPGKLHLRLGSYYAVGALTAIALACLGWPWTGPLLWPALACALTAAAYWGLGPGIYRKEHGRLPWSTRLLFAPCLIGQYLSLRYYRRQGNAWDQITPRLWISRRLNRRESAEARRAGVTAVLDLTAEFQESAELRALDYRNIPVLDLTAPNQHQLQEAVEFIADRTRSGVVCVHCKAGYSRSAAAVGAYLLASGAARTVEQAVHQLKASRAPLVLRPEVPPALKEFLARQLARWENSSPPTNTNESHHCFKRTNTRSRFACQLPAFPAKVQSGLPSGRLPIPMSAPLPSRQ